MECRTDISLFGEVKTAMSVEFDNLFLKRY